MYKDNRFINAGTNEFYRWGRKAQEKLAASLEPNENGFYSVAANGGNYWTFGTSEGKFGEFAKYKDTFLSVNGGGYVWAKAGTDKGAAFVEMIKNLLQAMKKRGDIEEIDDEEE